MSVCVRAYIFLTIPISNCSHRFTNLETNRQISYITVMLSEVGDVLKLIDAKLTSWLNSNEFTANLIVTPTSKLISELLVIIFILVLNYEIIYWSGIYLGLWQYHARHIFTEVPIHCAHVYVRINLIDQANHQQLLTYYNLKNQYKYNILNWSKLNAMASELFHLNQFVKYHLEFSPEDFESSDDPEFGSTIDNLRERILNLFNESVLYAKYHDDKLSKENVVIFNNKDQIVTDYSNYLSKCNIETGNVIDCIITI